MVTTSLRRNAVLVIGGGIAGARLAHELTQSGLFVYLIETAPTLGGITAQLGYMFPHHNCLLCRGTPDHGYGCARPSIAPELLDFNLPDNLRILTQTELAALSGDAQQGFAATLRSQPRYVDPALCINCHRCGDVCPVELPARYGSLGSAHKACYKPDWRAAPNAYVVEKGDYCRDCNRCADVCPTRAIDLNDTERTIQVEVQAVALATGYALHDPAVSAELGYGRVPNVITGFELERLLSPSGPSEGLLARPSDGAAPKRIAWLQCVGSRDKDHDYCSTFCCMYATKQAALVKQALPDAQCEIFFMDDRVFGKQFLDTYESMRQTYGIEYTRCRLFDLQAAAGEVRFRHLVEGKELQEANFDLVVLSVGAEPAAKAAALARMLGVATDAHGFIRTAELQPGATSRPGVFAAGCAAAPKDICDTTAEASAVASQIATFLLGSSIPASTAGNGESLIRVEEPRTGVFVCRCAEEIGGIIDVDALVKYAGGLPGIVHAQAVDFGCLHEGQVEIERAIAAHDLNRLVVGACNPRTHQPLFERSLRHTDNSPDMLEFVGLREFCTWPHRDQPEQAARKARELLRRAAARIETLDPVVPERVPSRRRALVVGGGLAGLTAALHLAERGVPVDLVDKADALGGNFARIRYFADDTLPQDHLADLLTRVAWNERIAVHLRTEVASVSGRVGAFRTTVRRVANGHGPAEQVIEHGAVILAAGASEYRGGAYGLGQDSRAITQLDIENEIAAHPDHVANWKSVAMINCVGPWSAPPAQGAKSSWRCSRNCCLQVMKNALRIKELNPGCQVVVFVRETMTLAGTEALYTEARRRGVLFVRYTDTQTPAVRIDDGALVVRGKDLSLGHTIELRPDRLALAVALMPNGDNAQLAALWGVDVLPNGFFAETEPKQRPTDFARPGVYLCGLAHGPKPSKLNIAQALAAAEEVVRLLAPGELTTNRAVAVVDEAHCMGCLTCVRVCPYGVPRIDSGREGKGGIMGASYIDPLLCQGCGTCPSECPGKAITLNHYRDDQVTLALGSWEA